MSKLTLIYPYRNRDLKRIKRSLASLAKQTVNDFNVFFVDYGSKIKHSNKVKKLVEGFSFTTYHYHHTQHQPWNKSRTLNSVIKKLDGGYCFVADVDIIFHPKFVERAITLQKPDTAVYFKVGFLDEEETQLDKDFNVYKLKFESTAGATGLSMFPVEPLQNIRGFDEFYHFWGSEDTDAHVRFKNAGYQVEFYNKEILMLHQWHHTYRMKETGRLTEDLQLSHIVRFNYQHLQQAIKHNKTLSNQPFWGESLTEEQENDLLEVAQYPNIIEAKKESIDHFLFVELPNLEPGTYAFKFQAETTTQTLKYNVKKALGKRVDRYYTHKQINDRLLQHIISFYRNNPYIYTINLKHENLVFAIQIP